VNTASAKKDDGDEVVWEKREGEGEQEVEKGKKEFGRAAHVRGEVRSSLAVRCQVRDVFVRRACAEGGLAPGTPAM
jgi:hypothetical protein